MSQLIPSDISAWRAPWTMYIESFSLVLFRVSGLLAVGPLLGRAILPWQARLGLALILSLLLTPLVTIPNGLRFDLVSLIPAFVMEFGLGFLLGCGSLLVLGAIPLAGRLLEQQVGTPLGDDENVFGDSPMVCWLTLWGAACFLLCSPINGHLQTLRVLSDSLRAWPLGSTAEFWEMNLPVHLLQQSCQLALFLVAPALATLTLVNLGIGLLGATGMSSASTVIGQTTRPIVAVVVLMATLSGVQQTVSDYVSDSIAVLTDSSSASR